MPARILIVEDDVMIRRLLVKTLEREALPIDTSGDGLEALEMIRTGAYGVVILDLMLPGISGYELLAACAGSLAPPLPSFIVTTAFDAQGRRGLDPTLVTAVIPKPFDVLMVTEIVSAAARTWPNTRTASQQSDAIVPPAALDQRPETI